MRSLTPALMMSLAACTPLNEQEIAEREYKRGEFRAEFLAYRKACEAKGGTVVIWSHRKIRADRVARPGDRYHCEVP